jgi:hypothetical protein
MHGTSLMQAAAEVDRVLVVLALCVAPFLACAVLRAAAEAVRGAGAERVLEP